MKLITMLCSLAVMSTSLYAQTSSQQGRIVGTVVNDDGEPIKDAELCTSITTPNGGSRFCGGNNTDDKGAFTISSLPLTKIEVYAQAPMMGYWQADSAIKKHSVILTPQAPVARVTLTVGPKPGTLILNVTDKTTGKTLDSFFVRLITDAGDSGTYDLKRSYNSGEGVLVPVGATTEEIVEVSAPGYKNWFYIDPSDPSRPVLRLASGEEKSLDVELEPK